MKQEDVLVSENLRDLADLITKELKKIAGKDMSFSLCVFNSEAGSRINYISNCKRQDVATAWASMIKGWGEGMPDIPSHLIKG